MGIIIKILVRSRFFVHSALKLLWFIFLKFTSTSSSRNMFVNGKHFLTKSHEACVLCCAILSVRWNSWLDWVGLEKKTPILSPRRSPQDRRINSTDSIYDCLGHLLIGKVHFRLLYSAPYFLLFKNLTFGVYFQLDSWLVLFWMDIFRMMNFNRWKQGPPSHFVERLNQYWLDLMDQ